MIEKLETSNLQKISIPRNSVTWFKKNKEIVLGNRLFDVKSSEVNRDSIIFTGLFDDQETRIKNSVAQLTDQQLGHLPSNKRTITQLVFQLWYCINYDYSLLLSFKHLANTNNWWYIAELLQVYSATISPPPKLN
jgi:hypothetical protein